MRWSSYSLFIVVLFTGTLLKAQVNPQNGAAQVSIPLYSYSDAGNRIGVSANLMYRDGNGMKVSEIASSVGTGWDLNCGGAIVRIQHGEPDDQRGGSTNYNYSTQYYNFVNLYYPDGYMYNSTYSPSDIIDNGGAYAPYRQYVPPTSRTAAVFKQQAKYIADREQDVFSFSVNGRSGQFVIGKNKVVRTLEDSKLKITFVEGNTTGSGLRTSISQFTVTDESGIQYVFRDMKYNYVCDYDVFRLIGIYNDPNAQGNVTTSTEAIGPSSFSNIVGLIFGRDIGQRIVDKWYLSEIVNPFSGRKITFNYTDINEDVNTDKHLTYAPYIDNGADKGSVNVYWQKYKVTDKRLTSVVLSNSERIDFTYGASRIDLPGDNSLSQLKVTNNNQVVYSWGFTYGYFVGLTNVIKSPTDTYTDDEKQWARLCLLTAQRNGTNGAKEPPYQFTYNMGAGPQTATKDLIPPPFSIYQDHWGYYNSPVVPATYPEGTLTAFYPCSTLKMFIGLFLNGDYRRPAGTSAKNGILKSITYPMGGTLSFTYEANNTATRQLGGVRVRTTTQYDGINHANDVIKQYNYINADNSSSGWGGETYTYFLNKSIHAANCTSSAASPYPLKEIASNYIENGFMTGTFGFTNSAVFSACLASALESFALSMAVMIIIEIFSGGNDSQDYTVKNYMSSSTVAGNPLPWGYARTEVVDLLPSGTAGKTVYEFTNPVSAGDHAIEVPTPAVSNSNKPRFAPWAYGLPKKVTVYDKDNKLVKQTVNHYSVQASYMTDDNFKSRSWETDMSYYACSLVPTISGTNYIQQEAYFPLVGHSQLDQTDEYVYNSSEQSSMVTTYYEYDYNYQLKHKYYNNSKGEKVETYYYHPYDYSPPTGAIAAMNRVSSNIVEPVLATEIYINKSDGNQYLIGASSTDFGFISNGDIKPRTTYTFQSPVPVLNSTLQPFSFNSVVRDPAYLKQVAMYDYDGYGNLVQTVSGGNKLVSSIYDYNGKYLAASVLNASYYDIGYTSFESDTAKTGGWVNAAAIITDDARTGIRCFNLSDPSNTANNYFGFGGLNSNLTYIVSFWGKNGSACIKGFAGQTNTVNTCQGSGGWTQGVIVNGWTYYEKQVSGVDKISMSGTGLVDECRIYPVGAQMRTTTYSALFGKTSECDASGRVTYYLYDNLGRLIKVADDARNVIRAYEYNYKQ